MLHVFPCRSSLEAAVSERRLRLHLSVDGIITSFSAGTPTQLLGMDYSQVAVLKPAKGSISFLQLVTRRTYTRKRIVTRHVNGTKFRTSATPLIAWVGIFLGL